jgi:hypothetical protein
MADEAVATPDFINEMYVAVVEECALWELARGSVDLLPEGPIEHGPWDPKACAAVVLRWTDAGLVDLYLPEIVEGWGIEPADWQAHAEQRGSFLVLAAVDARQLLAEPDRWTVESVDGHASLSRSDAGIATEHAEWITAANPA